MSLTTRQRIQRYERAKREAKRGVVGPALRALQEDYERRQVKRAKKRGARCK